MPKLSLFLTFFLLLSACASTSPEQDAASATNYATAMRAVRQGEVDKGIEELKAIIASSEGAVKSQAEIGLVFAYYTRGDYDTALKLGNTFLEANPGHPHLAYVYYLRALIRHRQGEEHLKRLMDTLDPANDYPEELREAYDYYVELIERYPKSPYAETAYKKILSIRKDLARYELHLARYEMVEGNHEEAVRHAEYVMQYFSDNLSRKYALTILIRAYQALDMPRKAENARRQLEELKVKIEK